MQAVKTAELQKLYISNKEAEAYLGVGSDFLKKLRLGGRLPYYKVGKTVFYKVTVLNRLVESGKVY